MSYFASLKVLVYGATGTQASPVVRHLLRRGHQPYVFTRHAAHAAALQAAGAQVVVGDLADAASCHAASQGMDAVALLVPFGAPDPVIAGRNAIDAARAAGVRLLVWNPSGDIPVAPTGNPAYDVRLVLRDYLLASGVPHVTLIPTVYAENLLGPWTAPALAARGELAYPVPAHIRISWLPTDDLGALTVAALERPGLAGQTFGVGGAQALTGPELAAEVAAGLGRPVSYRAMPPAEFGQILARLMGTEVAAGVEQGYAQLWNGGAPPARFEADLTPVAAALPVPRLLLREWAQQHAGAFAVQPAEPLAS